MNFLYQAKFEELFTEFTRYLIDHPEIDELIPEDAQVVLLDRTDPEFNRQAIELSEKSRLTDDVPHRPVVYIEVTEMAPVQSRVKKLQVHERPPAYTT